MDYVDNKKFTEELSKWTEEYRKCEREGKPIPKMPDYIGECIYLICTNLGYRNSYINYPYKDEMIGDAIENCVRYIKNFDGNKYNNAYGYVDMIASRAFHRRIKKEKQNFYNHIMYLRDQFVSNGINDALNADNPNDVKKYAPSYSDHMESILDMMEVEIPEEFIIERKKRKKRVNEHLIDEKGDEY